MSRQRLYGNMGSIFWPSAGTLDGRVLTTIDQQYYQTIVASKDCAQAQANVDRLIALRGATDPNSGDVAKAYCMAYEATWPKLQAWMASNNCPVPITQAPGSNTTTSPATSTTTTNTASKPSSTLALLFLAGGLVYMANKKKSRKK